MTLFSAGRFRAFEMAAGDMPAVQRLFEANPDYHRLVGGRPPAPDEALQEFLTDPAFEFGRKWCIGFLDEKDDLVGVAGLIADIFARDVWTVGLFFVATSLHGSGAARLLYGALEAWMRGEGARWSRLGVVEGNARAARFWEKAGYVDTRKRGGVEIGERVNTLRVMRPSRGTVADYLRSSRAIIESLRGAPWLKRGRRPRWWGALAFLCTRFRQLLRLRFRVRSPTCCRSSSATPTSRSAR